MSKSKSKPKLTPWKLVGDELPPSKGPWQFRELGWDGRYERPFKAYIELDSGSLTNMRGQYITDADDTDQWRGLAEDPKKKG